MGISLDLTNREYGYLTVISPTPSPDSHTRWLAKCICGNTLTVQTRNITRGMVKSCGCKSNELRSCNNPNNTGSTKDPAYKSFIMMKQRCNNPNYDFYQYYGGRGITISEEMSTFQGFKSILGERPDGYTLDRIDTNGNYEEGNVRWVSRAEQVNNRRNVRLFKVGNEELNIAQLARRYGKSTKFFRSHLIDNEESIDTVLTYIADGVSIRSRA